MAALGEGNWDCPRIIASAERAGFRWFIALQDQEFDDPFGAIERSYRFLTDQIKS